MPDEWIWICRWDDFQHYPARRDRGPAWIKDYTKQLDDDRYLSLSNRQRALLADLRLMFATSRARLRHDASTIGARRRAETRHADLKALSDAGLIEVCSRERLELHLEFLYSRSRSRDRKEETTKQAGLDNGRSDADAAELLAWDNNLPKPIPD